MTDDLQEYICRHIDAEPEYLHRIERHSNIHFVNGRMCSGHLQGRILKMLVGMIAPKRVLELGTFAGYSALCIAEALEEDATLTTVEFDDELEDFLRKTFADSPYDSRINLIIGDAVEVCKSFDGPEFDLIFIDADKKQYCDYYKESLRILKRGGYIIADNTLWDGHVVEADRHDSQTRGICRFNDMVAADSGVEKVIIPIRDGLTIIRKLNTLPIR